MINLGLTRISRLLTLLAHQRSGLEYRPPWKAIHIAGTNGKGSVAAYISALLNVVGPTTTTTTISSNTPRHEQNLENVSSETTKHVQNKINVGRFTSPHFIDSWDCIKINDQTVPYNAFERVSEKVTQLAAQVEQELVQETKSSQNSLDEDQALKDARLTEFELLTATAFELFSAAELGPCNIAVVECGLGGRLDATNALPSSAIQLSVITRIGLDHLDILGGSLQSIVREKCGILRKNVPIVIDGDNDPEVLGLIYHEITHKFGEERTESAVHVARAEDLDKLIAESTARVADIASFNSSTKSAKRLLELMPHQKSNLAIALKAFELLGIRRGVANTTTGSSTISLTLLENVLDRASKSYPGRLQWLQPGWLSSATSQNQFPRLNASKVLLDGAHNAQSARVLRSCVDKELQRTIITSQHQATESMENVYDDFAELKTPSQSTAGDPPSTTIASSPNTTTTATTDKISIAISSQPPASNNQKPPRKVIWILAMSSGKDIFEILETFIQSPNDEIIFTTFGPVQGMPWVKPTSLTNLVSSTEVLDLQYHIKGTVSNIVEALDVVEKTLARHHNTSNGNGRSEAIEWQKQEENSPLVVIAGSLYLVSDFLRFQRDGKDEFVRYWQESAALRNA